MHKIYSGIVWFAVIAVLLAVMPIVIIYGNWLAHTVMGLLWAAALLAAIIYGHAIKMRMNGCSFASTWKWSNAWRFWFVFCLGMIYIALYVYIHFVK